MGFFTLLTLFMSTASAATSLTNTVEFKMLPGSKHLADKVAHDAGLGSPRRIFRHAGVNEDKHVAAGLDLWFAAEPASTSRAAIQTQDQIHAAAVLALAKIRIAGVRASNVGDSRVAVELAQLEPVAQLLDTPNDPRHGEQTAFTALQMTDAWAIEAGEASVVVAVVDSGMDMSHPDLTNRWVNPGEVCGDGIDNDQNGFVDDCFGYNFADDTGDDALKGSSDHGTHCAGIVGANSDNGEGIAGTAGGKDGKPGVSLMTLTAFGQRRTGGFAEAIVYGADNGAAITTNSWGYTSSGVYDPAVLAAIDYFNANANSGKVSDGGIVVFAAGNDASNADHYPGYYAPVVTVSALQDSHKPASFTNYGSWVDISAPGVSILSTVFTDRGSYGRKSGTSMACPMVAGALGLLVSHRPGYARADYMGCLQSTATAVSAPDRKSVV